MRTVLVALAFAGCSSSPPVARPPQVVQSPPPDAAVAIVPVVIDAAPPPPVVSKLVDPATLPEWPMPAKVTGTGSPVAIAAVDATLDPLLMMLVPRSLQLVARTTGVRVTGRIDAPSREIGYAALAALAPDPAAFTARVPLAGKGALVTLEFAAAPMLDLLHVIAETLRINIVLPPGELPLLDVVVRRAPADAVLDRIAAVSGFDIRRAGNTFFLVPHGTTPAAPIPTHLKGKTVTIDANDASASDALRAITALVPLDVHVACDAGTKLHLRLRRLPADLATYAIAFASGLALEHGAPACPMEPTPAEPPPTTARLAIVAEAGIERVALFEDHATRYLVEPIAKVIEIGDGWVAYREPGLQREFQIHPPEVGEPGAWLRDSWRLMATVIDDAPVGLTELPDATWHTVSENRMPDATLIIDPGHLTVTLPNGFRSERHLERR